MINYSLNGEAISRLATSVFNFIGKPAPVEYAKAVKDLSDPAEREKILENRINDIENDANLSRSEKETLKTEVYDHHMAEETKYMQGCADVVDRDINTKSEAANKVLWNILGGVAVVGAVYLVADGVQNYVGQLQIEPRSFK